MKPYSIGYKDMLYKNNYLYRPRIFFLDIFLIKCLVVRKILMHKMQKQKYIEKLVNYKQIGTDPNVEGVLKGVTFFGAFPDEKNFKVLLLIISLGNAKIKTY